MKRWIWPKAIEPQTLHALSQQLGIHPLTAAVLWQRGFCDAEAARNFIDPVGLRMRSHHDLPGVRQAGELIADMIRRREPVMIYGDYDVDGITAAALLKEFILQRQGICHVHLPDRQREGYGVHADVVRAAAESGIRLLITVDCGITALDALALARDLGLKVVLTDHHLPGTALPAVDVLINPKVTGPSDLSILAGVGIAFMVARATAEALGENDPERLRPHLDLVALGTVADVVPLTGENRTLTRAGLTVINRGQRVGLRALAQLAGVSLGSLRAVDLAFRLAPRLNAAGRLGDPHRSLDLLLTSDSRQAEGLAQGLQQENTRRQTLEHHMMQEAVLQIPTSKPLPSALVIRGPNWPVGIVGLVASRLCERFHRPCFVLADIDGQLKGSGRSIPGFALPEVLQSLSEHLDRWGGHDLAAGVSLPSDRFDLFRQGVINAADHLPPETLQPTLAIDVEASLRDLDLNLFRELTRLEPFGCGNPRPLIGISRARVCTPPRVVGERHLKFKVTENNQRFLEIIGYGLADYASELNSDDMVSLAGYVSENLWNGSRSLQLELKDLQVVGST